VEIPKSWESFFSFLFFFLPLFLKIDCGRIFRLSEGAKGMIEGGAGNLGEGTGSEAYQADGAACEFVDSSQVCNIKT
jgi:hypothetical protein